MPLNQTEPIETLNILNHLQPQLRLLVRQQENLIKKKAKF